MYSKETIESNYRSVRERISAVCGRIGADPEKVSIVAITKTFPPDVVEMAVSSGLGIIGENKVQEAEDKVDTVRRCGAQFHMVGHLQTNKARKAVGLFDMIQSVDSVKVVKAVSKEAERNDSRMEILLQINCSGEQSKSGFHPDHIVEAAGEIKELPGVVIKGMMTIGPWVDDEGLIREDFRLTKNRFDELRKQYPELDLQYLSMGMSGDFEIALEEGSNMLRLGSVLFGPRYLKK